MAGLHRNAETGEVHKVYNYEYANEAARIGATGFASFDVGKVARQLDDNSLWMLTAVTPTWVSMGTNATDEARWLESVTQRQDLRDAADGYQQRLYVTNGAVLETVDIDVTSDGATVTFAIQALGGGDLTVFNDGGISYTVDTTPAATISLTAGSDVSPTLNYVYFLSSTMSLTVSTVSFPNSAAYSPLATVLVQSASGVQSDGVYKMHAYTDHVRDSNGNGHLGHLSSWIRQQPATWLSGVATTTNDGVATFDVAVSSGTILQLHSHTYPAFDTSVVSDIFIVNDFTTAFKKVGDLTGELTDSLNASMSNRAFFMTIWGVVSEKATDSKLMCNLPSGSYLSIGLADGDPDGTSVLTIPSDFVGTGFLIARILVKHAVGPGSWTVDSIEDLRGQFPSQAAGSTLTATTTFPDNQFEITSAADDTKVIDFDASAITTATTRTITMPDLDITLVGAEDGADGYLAFFTGPNSIAGDSELFWDDANGRLGIGTIVPKNRLDVSNGMAVGSAYAGVETAPADSLIISGDLGVGVITPSVPIDLNKPSSSIVMNLRGSANGAKITYRDSLDTLHGYIGSMEGLLTSVTADSLGIRSENAIWLATSGNNTRLVIDTSGQVGIGTISPSTDLEINGTDPSIIIRDTASASASTLEILDIQDAWAKITKTTDTGLSILDIMAIPADTTSDAHVRFFRDTDTSGLRQIHILAGDGTATVHGQISSGADDNYFNIGGGNFGIGTSTPDPSAKLEIKSTAGSLLLPRMTTTQKDALTNHIEGMVVYDSTLDEIDGYADGYWIKMTQNFQPFQPEEIPSGTTLELDFATGRNQIVELSDASGNVTLTLSNPVEGTVYVIKVIQGATARNLVWPAAVLWAGGAPPVISTTNNDIDIIQLFYDGTNYFGTALQAFA